MHYLVDGYNFLFRIKAKYASLEKKREALLNILNEAVAPLNMHVSIVFDSRESLRGFAERTHFEHLELVYTTQSQSADDYILEVVSHSKNPAILVVVTSDEALAKACRQYGAKSQTIKVFIEFLLKKSRDQKRKSAKKDPFKESPSEIDRLVRLFEDRLENS